MKSPGNDPHPNVGCRSFLATPSLITQIRPGNGITEYKKHSNVCGLKLENKCKNAHLPDNCMQRMSTQASCRLVDLKCTESVSEGGESICLCSAT